MKNQMLGAATILGLAAGATAGDASFTVIGQGTVVDMTPDGTTVLVSNGDAPYTWTEEGGAVLIPGGGRAVAISDDGTTVFGEIQNENGKNIAALWTEGTGWVGLGGFEGETGCDANLSNPYDLSGDGTIGVGLGWEGCTGRAFRWTMDTGMVPMPKIFDRSRANAISTDGSTIGGWDDGGQGRIAAIWTECDEVLVLEGLENNPTGLGEVWGFSTDGSIAVGQAHQDLETGGGFRMMNGEISIVPPLPGTDPIFHTIASLAVTDDGSIVFGTNISGFGPFADQNATYWTDGGGLQKLQDVLEANGAEIPEGHVVASANQTTPDGTVVAGTSKVEITQFAFIAMLPSTDCPEDIDGSGSVDFQDLLQLLAAWGDCPE